MSQTHLMLTGVLALAFAACSPTSTEAAAPAAETKPADAMAGMPMPAAPPAAAAITGVGKVAAVDAKAGTVKLDHDAIAALDWPAMSMTFTATDPAMLSGLAVGDAVTFEIKSAAESSVISKVEKQ